MCSWMTCYGTASIGTECAHFSPMVPLKHQCMPARWRFLTCHRRTRSSHSAHHLCGAVPPIHRDQFLEQVVAERSKEAHPQQLSQLHLDLCSAARIVERLR